MTIRICHINGCNNIVISTTTLMSGGAKEVNFCEEHSTSSYVGSGEAFEMYRLLENDFLRYIEAIPLTPTRENLNIYSRPLNDLIIRACTQIETIMRDWMFHYSFDSMLNIDNLRKPKTPISINEYATFLADKINNAEVFIRPIATDFIPFKDWTSNTPPTWWSNYNKIKHNGYFYREKGNLQTAVSALAGLFVINCRHPNASSYLQKYYLPFEKDSPMTIVRTMKQVISPIHERLYLFKIDTSFTTTREGNPLMMDIKKGF